MKPDCNMPNGTTRHGIVWPHVIGAPFFLAGIVVTVRGLVDRSVWLFIGLAFLAALVSADSVWHRRCWEAENVGVG